MHDMEEGSGSAEPSGGVVKKKSSSGCLIIKKKGDGICGFGGSSSKKGIESKKEKKRSRLILSDSGSSDELDSPPRRKVASKTEKFGHGSAVHKESFSKKGQIESERKRSGLDVFEFDEYENYDGKMREYYMDDRSKIVGQSGNKRESGIGSSKNAMVDKTKHSYVDGRSSTTGKSKGPVYTKKRHKEDDEETHLTISSLREKYREACDEPIRLQGRNGVLKVMVNKQKKPDLSHKSYDCHEAEDRKGSRSEEAVKKSEVVRPSFHSDSKRTQKRVSFAKTEKIELKLQKSLSTKSSKARESEKVDTDKPKKLGSASMQVCSSTKRVKKEGQTTPPTEKFAPVKRGTGTEKQLLREKVRSMLVNAGWTIDYRPRRNRDYLDAVYINPSGTAYWSIIKAYDAFQKQLEEEDVDDIKPSKESSQSSPLPDEILSKLTRQTQKKIERATENHEDRLSFYMKHNHKSKKRKFHVGEDDRVEKSSVLANSRRSGQMGRCTLLVRSSEKGPNSEDDDFVPYTGKRTILAWLIDSGIVQMSEKVQYMNRRKTRVFLEGWITRDGIHCGCCSKILTVSKFEVHAGSKLKQPFSNIFVESGISLLQCQIEAWNKQKESKREGFHSVDVDDPNDDTCGLCGDGGDLICCDGCPSTFHQSCLDIEMLPPGEWHCPNCTCKFCGIGGRTTSEANGTTVGVLFTCSLCEKKFHESCSQEIDDLADSDNATTTFCGQTCRELFGQLRKLIGVKHELEEGFSWSLIHRMDPSSSDTVHPQRVECNSKLAVALSIMDECFLPIVDRRSEINLIHSVLYNCGSNFDRLNYSSFYTAILERGDEIISAASIRIHGNRLAEMPFIGTRHIYRRQGMCRRLFSAIESVLCSLKVEKLIIPAITEHLHTWTDVFNFNPIEDVHKQEMRSINMLVFPGIDMLQKQLAKPDIPEGNTTTKSDKKAAEVEKNHPLLPVTGKDTELDSSDGYELQQCDEAGVQHVNEMDDKLEAKETVLQVPALPKNESNVNSSSTDSPCESKLEVLNEETSPINAQSESTANMECPSSSNASPVNLEISDPVLDPLVKGNSDAQEASGEASCVGLVLDNITDANENHNSVPLSTVICTNEKSSMQSNSDLNHHSAVEVETKLPLAMEVASKAEIAPAESKRDVCEVSVEIASFETIPVSSLEISTPNTTENAYGNKSAKGTAEPNQPVLDSDNHEGEVAGGESSLPHQNIISPTSRGCNPVSASTLCGADEDTVQLSSDLNNVSEPEVDCEVPVVSECGSGAKVSKVQSNNELEDNREVDVKVASIETDVYINDTADEAVENQTPTIKVNESSAESSSRGSNDSTLQTKSVSDRQSAVERGSEVHVATEVASSNGVH